MTLWPDSIPADQQEALPPVYPWLAGLHSPVPDLLRVLCSAFPSTPHNAIHEKLLRAGTGLYSRPHAFRNAATNPVCATIAGAFAFYTSEQLYSVPLSRNGCDTLLSRVHHEHNVRLLACASRIKNIGC